MHNHPTRTTRSGQDLSATPDQDITSWAGRTPRAWQREALPVCLSAIRSGRSSVVVAATGAGKSILQAELIRCALPDLAPHEVVVVGVPRQRLVRQLVTTIAGRVADVGSFYADRKEPDRRVIVACYASIPALASELEARGLTVGLFVGDEIHGTEAVTVKRALEALAPRMAIGFTATPFRADDRDRLTLWDDVCVRYTIGDALRDGVLVPPRVVTWDGRGTDDADVVTASLILEHAPGPGIVSATSIADAERYADFLTAQAIPAEAIHSRLPDAVQDALIERLRVGELRALVHVALLAEGVDLPWLRWLALRRPVRSRVRFVQEVGRVLRVAPHKDHALILDPHDLWASHGITHPEALGEPLERDPGEPREELEDVTDRVPRMPPAVAVHAVTAWLRRVVRDLESAGLPRRQRAPGLAWRDDRASPRQLRAARSMAWTLRYAPPDLRADLACLAHDADALPKGAVSELLALELQLADAVNAAKKAGRWFRWPGLDIPPCPVAVDAVVGGAP